MKSQHSARSLLLLSFIAGQASAATPSGEECRFGLPGITFTRSLNEVAAQAKVEEGRITLASEAKRDNFRDPDGKLSNNTAPLLLTEVDNRQPFTLTARVTPTFLETYDAGALYIYVKEDLWLKMALEIDERRKTRMVTVRTIGTSRRQQPRRRRGEERLHEDVVGHEDGRLLLLARRQELAVDPPLQERLPGVDLGRDQTRRPLGAGTSSVFEGVSLTKGSVSDFRLGI